jgi:hypothetical protein
LEKIASGVGVQLPGEAGTSAAHSLEDGGLAQRRDATELEHAKSSEASRRRLRHRSFTPCFPVTARSRTCAFWARRASRKGKRDALETIIDGYLSPRHRKALGEGCAVAALGSDLPRQPTMVRRAFTKKLEESLAILASLVPAKAASRRDDVAIQLFSSMLGGLILSRAVDDESLSRRILRTVADELKSMPRS